MLLTDFHLRAAQTFSRRGPWGCDTTFIPLGMFARRTVRVYATQKTGPSSHLLPILVNNRDHDV